MICFKCGHLAKYHAEFLYPNSNAYGCNQCFRFTANNSKFCKHPFEGNLEYLERKSLEKPSVA